MKNNNIFSLKYIILFFILFIILYFENISFGIIKLSQIWKVPFYTYFLFFILKKNNENILSIPKYVAYSLILFIAITINTSNPLDYVYNLTDAFSILTLPFAIAYFKIKKRETYNNIDLFIISFSSFLILFNLPFILHLIPNANRVNDLSSYGLYNKFTLTGVFYHINIASKINVVSTLIIIFNKKYFYDSLLKKLLYLLLIIIGSYSIYLNFARTGWFLFLFGLIFIITYKEKLKKLVLISIPIITIIFYLFYGYISKNQAIKYRLLGETTYRTNQNYDANQISSGRLAIWDDAINNLISEGPLAIIFGQGVKKSMDLMKNSYGYFIPAHNKFIEILQYSGIIGLFLYLKIIYLIYIEVKRIKIYSGEYHTKLPLAIFLIFIISCIPSHGLPLWSDILLGGIIVVGQKK